jgi:hypothetical protein
MDHNSLTVITTCWGDYWEKYGKKWLEIVTNLDPQPAEILFVSRDDIDLPDLPNLTHIIDKNLGPANWYTGYVRFASKEWVTMFTLDDQMPLNGFANLKLEGDVVIGPCRNIGDSRYHMVDIHMPSLESYDKIFEYEHYPLTGWAIFKREILLKIPSRPIDWEDWALFLELRQHNVDVRIDPTIRNYYFHHENQRSKNINKDTPFQIYYLKQVLPSGRVIPAAEWPPRFQVSEEERILLLGKADSNGNIIISDFFDNIKNNEKN